MKRDLQDRLKQGLCILLLIGVSTASSSAQNSWREAYQSPPDAVLRFQTDSNGKILPARVFGLDTLRGGAFSHSGTRFLMHSDSRIVYTDFINKTPLFARETVGSKITSVSISPDDKILLTGYESGEFSAWFLDTGYPFLRHQGHSTEITATAFSSHRHAFATADDTGRFKIWSLNEAPRPILSGELGTEVKTLKFSPTGRLLLVGGPSSRVRVIEVETGEPLLELANEASYLITAEISKDETELFTAHRRNPTRRIWDLRTGELKRELPTLNPSQNAYLDASIDRIATIESSGRMTFYSFLSGQQLHRQNVLPGNTSSFSLSPSGDYLFRQTNFGEIYRRKDDQKLMVLPNHIRHVRSLAISPDSTQLASSAGGLSTTRIQDLRTGQLLNTIAAAPAQIRFSRDNKYIYDARSGGKALARSDERLAGSDPSIVAVSITTDQHLVLQSFNQSPITVIDQTNGRTEKELESSAGFENTQFTISPDHSLIASLSQRVIKVWQTQSGRLEREIRTDSNHQSIQFSPDSRNIITVDADRGIAVWDPRHVWPGTWIEHADSPMTAIAVAPNGKNTAVGQADGRLFILDLTTGGVQSQLSGHRSAITAVQYSPDGQWIVSGDSDGLIKTWPVSGFEPSPLRLTREEGETLRLAVEGTSFFAEEIVWHKDEIPIATPETQDGQQLRLPSLEARDSGIYRGTMKTDAGQTRTVALALTVLRPTEETQSFEQWVQQFPWGSHSQARDEDADGDQWTNLEEYFLGTHPLEFQTSERPLQIQQGPQGNLMLRIRLAPHARAARIQLESSPNLNLWGPIELSLNETVQADGSTHWSATLPNDSVARFIRWKMR